MAKVISESARYEYRLVRAELWGNAKDGFDTNNWFVIDKLQSTQELSRKYLTTWVKNGLAGYSFAWSENISRPMVRDGIELESLDQVMWFLGCGPSPIASAQVMYRGHYVGELQLFELEPQVQSVSMIEDES